MNKILPILLAFILLSGSGCFDFSKKTLRKRLYSIRLDTSSIQKAESRIPGILKIRRFSISPVFAGRSFVYHRGHGEYESDYYNEFIVSPDLNLVGVMENWLDAAEIFTRVISPSSQLQANYILEGSIYSLYGDYSKSDPFAVLEIKFLLITDESTPVFEKKYRVAEKMKDSNSQDLVAGYHQALEKILTHFQKDLVMELKNKKLESAN